MANPRTIARLESRIHERAAHCLQFEINDPRAGFITILKVELADDLSAAKIFYSVLGDAADRNRAAHMLKGASGYIQRQVARVLEMRRIPHIAWEYDDSIEKAADLDLLIREARLRDKAINPNADESEVSLESGRASANRPSEAAQDSDADDDSDGEAEDDEDGGSADDADEDVDEEAPDQPERGG
ncbi:MAG: 30S ribosome-binding factor RbfA [Planctomycetota bacterium]|nr:30S ribosome-binding factor RbfA [Planctomycetota bacterium]